MENPTSLHNLDNATIMDNMVRETPKIYAALEEWKLYNQSTVIKVEGNISQQFVSILIDLGSTHSYVTP